LPDIRKETMERDYDNDDFRATREEARRGLEEAL
jgi:hypothetical protein